MRSIDLYNPVIGGCRAAEIEDEFTTERELCSSVIREAATGNGATMVSPYDVLTGQDHSNDLAELGYILSDGQHLTDEAHVLIGEALAGAGFEPSQLPH